MAIFAVLPYFAGKIYNYQFDHFTCSGKIVFSDENRNYSVHVKYIFDEGAGEVVTLGEYQDSNMTSRRLSQQLSFNYTHKGDEIVMLSTKSTLNDANARMLDSLVPDFYLYRDRGFRIRIFKQGESGYVFTTFGVPVFICTKH